MLKDNFTKEDILYQEELNREIEELRAGHKALKDEAKIYIDIATNEWDRISPLIGELVNKRTGITNKYKLIQAKNKLSILKQRQLESNRYIPSLELNISREEKIIQNLLKETK